MDWDGWHRCYDASPHLQARLRAVTTAIARSLDACPPGPIRLASLCAGDGRDVVGALASHRRRADVTAWLLDLHEPSLARGRRAARKAGVADRCRFVHTDASRLSSWTDIAPVDVLVVSGLFGHLRHGDAVGLVERLPVLCAPGARVVWSRHGTLHDGAAQLPALRVAYRATGFEEIDFGMASPAGFGVGCARWGGQGTARWVGEPLFEFVGLDRL